MRRGGRWRLWPVAAAVAATALAPASALAADAGTLDPSFGDGGNVLTGLTPSDEFDYAEDVTVQPDGKIVAVGAANDSSDALVVRYDADGSLDTDFGGGDGIVVTDVDSDLFDVANAVAIQPDGKIVVCGVSQPFSEQEMFVARYNANGTLDASFDGPGGSGNGVVVIDLDTGNDDACEGVALTGSKVVAAGFANTDTAGFAFVAQFNGSDGTLDSAFDGNGGSGNGIVLTDFFPGGLQSEADDVVVQSDGKIVIGGSANTDVSDPGTSFDGDFALARYNGTTGVLDTTFGGDGIVTTDVAGDGDRIRRLAIQPSDGMIVAAGTGQPVGQERDFAVARYDDADGTLDPSFDGPGAGNGKFSFSLSTGDEFDEARDVEIDSAGRIVMAGPVTVDETTLERDVAVVRLLGSNGDFDDEFSGDGKVIQSVGPADDFARGVAIDADDNVITAGDSEVSDTEDDLLVQRYLGEETPVISVGNVSVPEGDSGTRNAVFHVTLDEAPLGPLSVDYATADGTAIAPSDYSALSTTSLPFGMSDTDKTVTVTVKGDTKDEPSERFRLELANAEGAVIADDTGVGTIVDDDDPQTRITKAPKKRSADRTPAFKFVSPNPEARFQCKLDRGKFRRCRSPKRYRDPLPLGRHTFKVRAKDAEGNLDPTPAKARFKIVAP